MKDQIYSPEKNSMKNSFIKNIFYSNEKEYIWQECFLTNTNLFWLNEKIFWYHEKEWCNENIFYQIQSYFDWIKINFHIIWIFIFVIFQQLYAAD